MEAHKFVKEGQIQDLINLQKKTLIFMNQAMAWMHTFMEPLLVLRFMRALGCKCKGPAKVAATKAMPRQG